MVIQLPEWTKLRIVGSESDWEVQRQYEKGKNVGEWHATNFFPSLEHAVGFAYEKSLRKSPTKAETVDEMKAECKRVKDELLEAVEKAVS